MRELRREETAVPDEEREARDQPPVRRDVDLQSDPRVWALAVETRSGRRMPPGDA